MPGPAHAHGLHNEPSKGGRSPATTRRASHSLLAALNGGHCPVPAPHAGLGEGLPRCIGNMGHATHPFLAEAPAPRSHVLQLGPGVPPLEPRFPGCKQLWKSFSCTGAHGGAITREPARPASPGGGLPQPAGKLSAQRLLLIYARAELTESSLDTEMLLPCSILPLLFEHRFCCHHFSALRVRGMEISRGVTLLIGCVQGDRVWHGHMKATSTPSNCNQQLNLGEYSTRVIPLFSFLKYSITHFLLLFYFLFQVLISHLAGFTNFF